MKSTSSFHYKFIHFLSLYRELIGIGLRKLSAYRVDLFLTVTIPALSAYLIKFLSWSGIYEVTGSAEIGNLNLQQMLHYQGAVLFMQLLSQGYNSNNLSEEIRLGKITHYLLYPLDFFLFQLSQFLSFMILQFISFFLALVIFSSLDLFLFPTWSNLILGMFLGLQVAYIWFLIQFFTGILGLWLEETWILRVIFILIVSFLSGGLLPLDLFPPVVLALLKWTPFPYMTYYPAKYLMNEGSGFILASSLLFFWSLFFAFICKKLWKKGLRLYSAAGM